MLGDMLKSGIVREISEKVRLGIKNITVAPVPGCFKGILYAAMGMSENKDVVIITSTDSLYSLYGEISGLSRLAGNKANVMVYPEKNILMIPRCLRKIRPLPGTRYQGKIYPLLNP